MDINELLNSPQLAISTGVIVILILLLMIAVIKWFLRICLPNEVMVVSGGRYKRYRPFFGGRVYVVPILERAQKMSLNLVEVPISIRGAYSQGGIPLNVDAIANVKIASDPKVIGNAIERFLGRDPNEIRRVAKETLEGHLRGVLARLTPEQVNEDRLRFAEELSSESELDLNKLGIHLDILKIQHVSDDVHYLDSIGRGAIANVVREAEMSESDAKRLAEQAEAENTARGGVARANAQANIAKMQNEFRKIKADLEAQVQAEEQRTLAAAKEARALAEQELQTIRAELEGLRLQADQVIPAEAQQLAESYKAKGDAAAIRERGLAVAESLDLVTGAWKDAGSAAMSILLIEDIEKILEAAAKGVTKVRIKNLKMIDAGDGSTLAGYIASYPEMLASVLNAVQKTTGIDVRSALSGEVISKEESK